MSSSSNPLVSVIMPACNAEPFIGVALQSLREQSYPRLEVLVVDDHSTDATVARVQEAARDDPRIRLLHNPRKGVSSARNCGLLDAAGDIITFLDADDACHGDAIQRRAAYLARHEDAKAVFCPTRLTGPDLEDLDCVLEGKPTITFEDFYDNPMHTNAVMLRAPLIQQVGFDEAYHNGEDWLAWQRIARMGVVFRRVVGSYVLYRQHHGTVLRDLVQHENALKKVLDVVYGPDAGCPCPDPRYRHGLAHPHKALVLLRRRIRLFFFLLMRHDMVRAKEVGSELLSCDLSAMGRRDYLPLLRAAMVRAEYCHANAWPGIWRQRRQQVEPYLHAFLPQDAACALVADASGPQVWERTKLRVKRRLAQYPGLDRLARGVYRRLRGVSDPAASCGARGKEILIYVPAFRSREDFTDQYYRMLWYCHPMLEALEAIVMPVHGSAAPALPEEVPAYLDPSMARWGRVLKEKLVFFDADDVDLFAAHLARATCIMEWDGQPVQLDRGMADLLAQRKRAIRTWRIDRVRERYEGSFYLKVSSDAALFREDDLAHSRGVFRRLCAAVERIGRDRVYIFGTGPTLAQALDPARTFDDGWCIACNSMVRNEPLMRKLRPPIIVASDPVFHAGCSLYAGAFRQSLMRCLDASDAFFVTTFRDYRLYCANLPRAYRDRIVGIPFRDGARPNFDLARRFEVMTHANVLTLLLVPLATTFAREVCFFGNDGRRLDENAYFWKHDENSQLGEHMASVREAHPGFFAIDYDAYYLSHIRALEAMLIAGEKAGYRFRNLTPSFIPALEARRVK